MSAPVEIRTEMIRAGRRTATGRARLLQNGREALHATATFTDLSAVRGRTLMFGRAPDRPLPADTIDLVDSYGNPTSELWMRLTEGGGGDALALPFIFDAAATPAIEIGAVSSTTVELTDISAPDQRPDGSRAKPPPGSSSMATTKRTSKSGAQTAH